MPELIAGVDEVGRGPIAGPVMACAVILDSQRPIAGLADSKTLSPKRREQLCQSIKAQALSYAVASVEVEMIDEINILQASLLAMQQAVLRLSIVPQCVLVDGHRCPELPYLTRAIVQGDKTEPCISAASIVAKVTRDALLVQLDKKYPGYGLAQHKGYPTRAHCAALHALGPSPIHRRTFEPVKALLASDETVA